ncbi:MAG: T9SS type A sorting domain-containing protein [Candidatus Zixiibacteriota bacterium]
MYRVVLLSILCLILLPIHQIHCEDLHQIFHFHGETSESGIGFALKALGDINSDGFDDIAFSSATPEGSYIFLGGNPVDSFPDYFLNRVKFLGKCLDYDGDGEPELVASWDSALYLYEINNGILDVNPSDSLGITLGRVQFRLMESGSFDSDSIGDIIMRAQDPYNGPCIYLYKNLFYEDFVADWSYCVDSYQYEVNKVGFIDFNGDSIQDIFLPLTGDIDTLGYIHIYLGPTFAENPDLIIGHPFQFDAYDKEWFGQMTDNVGDINGDGFEDLGVASYYAGRHSLVYLGGPTYDTVYDYWLDGKCFMMSKAGDVNGDNYNDLIIGGSDYTDGSVILYFGGAVFDSIRDDYIIRGDLPPLFLDKIGWNLTGAGDFNRDGFDDILFKCSNFAGNPGDIFIFSAGDDILGIDDEFNESILPDNLYLKQNYPNPFNPTTTIEFELTRKSNVELTVYDILGRRVSSLINQQMPVGSHSIKWDGRNQNGDNVASGIYFYKIKTDQFSDTKKMVLVR